MKTTAYSMRTLFAPTAKALREQLHTVNLGYSGSSPKPDKIGGTNDF